MKVDIEKKAKTKYSAFHNICFLTKDMAKVHPLLIFFLILEAGLSVLSPILGIYLPKVAIDLVISGADVLRILYTLGGFALIMTLVIALSSMAASGKYMLYNDMRMYYMKGLFLKSLDCDYNQIESAAGQNKYQRAFSTLDKGDWSGTSKMTVATIDVFVAVLSFILYSGIISTLNFFVVLLLVALSSINIFAVKNAQNYEYQHKDSEAELNKKLRYVENIAGDVRAGKDIRLYGMTDWFLAMRDILLDMYTALNRKIRTRYFIAGTVNAITLFLRDGIAYGYLIWAVSTQTISVGDFVLYFGAITGFSGFVSRIVNSINELNGANLQINDMREFFDNTDAPEPQSPAELPAAKKLSIEFQNVSFSYKNGIDVLRHFNMRIDEGEKVALVGVNGAGKTTIVKLLCGFYQPDSGEILINGMNINQYRKKDLFTLFSAVFQDVLILPFTVAENISMQLTRDTDMERVMLCLKKTGLDGEIMKHSDGIHCKMTKNVEEGIILSGGQQQKLLMARALYKDAPILILDEPTAALDPIAESETYQAFHSLAKGKTSIYISHRLASTRFCDRIIFLHHGMAEEVGTHEELLKKGGHYAKMFEIQSHYYNRKEVSSNEIQFQF